MDGLITVEDLSLSEGEPSTIYCVTLGANVTDLFSLSL